MSRFLLYLKGGFLSQYIENKSIEKCIDCGIWASGEVIQQHGRALFILR